MRKALAEIQKPAPVCWRRLDRSVKPMLGTALILVKVFFGHVVFGHFSRSYFSLVSIVGPLDTFYPTRFEGVPLVEQFADAFRIGTLNGGQALRICVCGERSHVRRAREGYATSPRFRINQMLGFFLAACCESLCHRSLLDRRRGFLLARRGFLLALRSLVFS